MKGAFHYLLRELAINGADLPPSLQTRLIEEGFNVDELHANKIDISDQCLDDLIRVLTDAHDCTWAQVRHDEGCILHTLRGSRPGSPVADMAFNYFMGFLVREVQKKLAADEDLQALAIELGVGVHCIAWVDDLMVPLFARSNALLLATIQKMVIFLHQLLSAHGFLLNYQRGKTEVIANFRGPSADAHRRQVFIEDQGAILLPDAPSAMPRKVFATGLYQHLGTKIGQNCSLEREILHRLAQATEAFHCLYKPVLGNKSLSVRTRLKLCESLVLTKLFYNSGHWERLPSWLATKVQHRVTSWQRRITGEPYGRPDQTTDHSFRMRWG